MEDIFLPESQLNSCMKLAQKFNCSPESLHEESVREQLLKLQKNISYAVDEAHCVLQCIAKYETYKCTVGCGCESLNHD